MNGRTIEHEQVVPFGDPPKSKHIEPFPEHGNVENTGLTIKKDLTPAIVDANPYVQMIAVAAAQDVDVEKLEKLMDLQERWEDRQAKHAFVVAMATVQESIEPVIADAENDQTGSRYSKLTTIVSALAPHYTKEGFSLSFSTGDCASQRLIDDGWFRTLAELNHVGGYTKTYHVDLPADTRGPQGTVNKTVIHGTKSAITYARVILMGLIFNFTTTQDVDNDGNTGPVATIDDKQVCVIKEAIEAGAADEAHLLKWQGVDCLEDIREQNWTVIENLIMRKYSMQENGND